MEVLIVLAAIVAVRLIIGRRKFENITKVLNGEEEENTRDNEHANVPMRDAPVHDEFVDGLFEDAERGLITWDDLNEELS